MEDIYTGAYSSQAICEAPHRARGQLTIQERLNGPNWCGRIHQSNNLIQYDNMVTYGQGWWLIIVKWPQVTLESWRWDIFDTKWQTKFIVFGLKMS